jgi:hypothetical protein
VAVAEAEAYANGERRRTVATGDLESAADAARLHALHAGIEAAVAAAGYRGGATVIGRNDRATWCWRSTPEVPAAELVRAARAVAERLDPGWWRIAADDH